MFTGAFFLRHTMDQMSSIAVAVRRSRGLVRIPEERRDRLGVYLMQTLSDSEAAARSRARSTPISPRELVGVPHVWPLGSNGGVPRASRSREGQSGALC
jgi:hypothetical protein